MQLPRVLARFNKHVTNRIQGLWAPLLPGYGVVQHVGRRTGTVYRTPVNMYETADGFAVALFYGSRADWVRNVLAADGGVVIHRRRRSTVAGPRIISGAEGRAVLPVPIRLVGRVVRNDDVLVLTISEPTARGPH